MKEHHITSDIHFGLMDKSASDGFGPMPKPTGVAEVVEAELARLGITHNVVRPYSRRYIDLPDMTPTGPVTIHHIGDFV